MQYLVLRGTNDFLRIEIEMREGVSQLGQRLLTATEKT
jgi:hypothetical protein